MLKIYFLNELNHFIILNELPISIDVKCLQMMIDVLFI